MTFNKVSLIVCLFCSLTFILILIHNKLLIFPTFFAVQSSWLLTVPGQTWLVTPQWWRRQVNWPKLYKIFTKQRLISDMGLLETFVKSSIDGVVIELDKGNTPYVAGEKVILLFLCKKYKSDSSSNVCVDTTGFSGK